MTIRKRTIPILGGAALAVSVVLFFVFTGNRQQVDWWALLFILMAELLTTAGFISMAVYRHQADPPSTAAGAGGMLGIYAVISIALSLLFMTVWRELLSSLIMVQAALAAMIVVFLLLLGRAAEADRREFYLYAAENGMLADRIDAIQLYAEAQPYRQQLNQLREALQSCGRTAVVEMARELSLAVFELEAVVSNGQSAAIEQHIAALQQLAETAQTKY